ncbi:MAG: hypothetical protein GX633_06850 [Clostridiales bacterium]|nr:hypothetical protein [Clostridiales bacterium]
MKLSDYTIALLEDIEKRIDCDTEDDFHSQWRSFWSGEFNEVIFAPKRRKTTMPSLEVRQININDALSDLELMLDHQLAKVSHALSVETYAPCVRANYGTGIMTSLFGAEIFVMPREMDTLPTTRSYNDSEPVRRILERGIPDLCSGFGQNVFGFGELAREVFSNYPKIEKYVTVFHPDTQGPLDVCELLWGSEMFYEMYDDPDFVHDVMTLISETFTAFLEKWYKIIPKKNGLNVHWSWVHPGPIMLRNDSAMNLSPELYREFALKYDKRLLEHFSGGCVHFCGRGDHYIDMLLSLDCVTCINFSQPHLNNMDVIFDSIVRNNKKFLAYPRQACLEYAKRPDAIKGYIHISED